MALFKLLAKLVKQRAMTTAPVWCTASWSTNGGSRNRLCLSCGMPICIISELWLVRLLRSSCAYLNLDDCGIMNGLTNRSIETEDNQEYLLQDILLKRYSIMIDGEQTSPANVIERAVDLHALMVTGSSGYQVSNFLPSLSSRIILGSREVLQV